MSKGEAPLQGERNQRGNPPPNSPRAPVTLFSKTHLDWREAKVGKGIGPPVQRKVHEHEDMGIHGADARS